MRDCRCTVKWAVLAEWIVVRKVGEFVGRRHELRCSRRALRGPKAGLVIHGIGGVGKSTLSAELISQQAASRVLVSLRGALSVDRILDELGARLTILRTGGDDDGGQLRAWAQQLRAGDIEWSERWRALAEVILPALPILVLLDNFEDNLPAVRSHAGVWLLAPGGRGAPRPASPPGAFKFQSSSCMTHRLAPTEPPLCHPRPVGGVVSGNVRAGSPLGL